MRLCLSKDFTPPKNAWFSFWLPLKTKKEQTCGFSFWFPLKTLKPKRAGCPQKRAVSSYSQPQSPNKNAPRTFPERKWCMASARKAEQPRRKNIVPPLLNGDGEICEGRKCPNISPKGFRKMPKGSPKGEGIYERRISNLGCERGEEIILGAREAPERISCRLVLQPTIPFFRSALGTFSKRKDLIGQRLGADQNMG